MKKRVAEKIVKNKRCVRYTYQQVKRAFCIAGPWKMHSGKVYLPIYVSPWFIFYKLMR